MTGFETGAWRAIAVAGLLAWAAPAAADTVNATFLGADPVGGTVRRTIVTGPGAPQNNSTQSVERFNVQFNSGTIANTFLGTGGVNQFSAFCIEPRQSINANVAVNYDYVPLEQGTTNIGGMGTEKADLIRELFGRWMPYINGPMTALQAGAFQVAIWEIVRETPGTALDVFSGNIFFATPETTAGTLAQAQTYVQSLTGSGPRASGLFALNNGPMGDPGVSAGTQDLLVQIAMLTVPEPASMAVLGVGLLGLAAARRGSRRAGVGKRRSALAVD